MRFSTSLSTFRSAILLTGVLTLFAAAPTHAQNDNGVYAIVDARVEIGDGRVLDRATILLRQGLIEAVGTDIKTPADAEVIKGAGLTVYPGFIDACCTAGLKLPEWQPEQDRAPDTSAVAPASMREANRKGVRSELRAVDCLSLNETTLLSMRRNGFTAALFAPGGGMMSGSCGLVSLSGMPKRDAVINPTVAQAMAFTEGQGGGRGTGYPGSLLGIIAHMRQTLLDAARAKAVKARFERKGGLRPAMDDTFTALAPVLDSKMPVLFECNGENDIPRALRLADEFHLKLILNGASYGRRFAKVIKERSLPVVATLAFGDDPSAKKDPSAKPSTGDAGKPGAKPSETAPEKAPPAAAGGQNSEAKTTDSTGGASKPQAVKGTERADKSEEDDPDDTPPAALKEQHDKWQERVENAAQLEKAGIAFSFSSSGLKPGEFWKNLRIAVKSGLSRRSALRALTVTPAQLLGVERYMGSIEAGKAAHLVIMTGDFVDEAAKIKYLFIDRMKFDPAIEPKPAGPAPAFSFPGDEEEGGAR